MNLKTFTISGPINARVRNHHYVTVGDTAVFAVNHTETDGWTIFVLANPSATAELLAADYATQEDAQDALDEFMKEQGFEEIKQEETE